MKILIAIFVVMFLGAIIRVASIMLTSNAGDAGALMGGMGLIIICFLLYFLPSIVGRRKQNANAIFVLNLLLGWTIVGWVVAMVWAVAKDAPPVVVNQVAAPEPPILCRRCGRYSAPGAKFCGDCGRSLSGIAAVG